jgi:hypothetical protein
MHQLNSYLHSAYSMLGLLFDLEAGGGTFLRNVFEPLPDYTAYDSTLHLKICKGKILLGMVPICDEIY